MAPALMKAAICKEPSKPLSIDQVPVPTPTGRFLLVRVQATSLCHSDISITSGLTDFTTLPQIIGHEAISVVEELGPEAAAFGIKVGDRIGAPLWQDMCLSCTECIDFGPQFCPKLGMKGVTRPGYFAEYSLVDAASAVVLPDADVSAAELATIFCAGVTVWDALERASLKPGETVAIVGVGGLGDVAVKYAQALGARVLALDVVDAQLESVRKGGYADGTLNTHGLSETEVLVRVLAMNRGRSVDAVVVTSGAVQAYQTAAGILRPEGRLLVVGIPMQEIPFHAGLIVSKTIKIIGAKVPGQAGAARCLEFSRRKGIYPKVHPRKFQLEDINEMISLMQAGKVHDGRMVVQFF